MASATASKADGAGAAPAPLHHPGAAPAPAGAPWSLQRRLRRQLLALLCTLWLAASLAALAALWRETTLILDSAMAETAERLAELPEAMLDARSPVARIVASYPADEYVVYQVFDRDGVLRLRSHSAPAAAIDRQPSGGIRDVDGWRVLTLVDADNGRRVLVAEPLAHRRALLWAGVRWLALVLAAVLALAAWALGMVLRRTFGSLEAPRAELQARAADDLRPLAASRLPTELQPWLDAVNALMTRVRGLLEAERAFAGHAAHELRTPLAAARARAQRIAEAPVEAGATRDEAQALLRQLDRLAALSTRVLQLARVDSGVALRRDAVNLAELVELVADEFADARRRGALVVEPAMPPCVVEGDVDALGMALRNLVDNALVHGSGPVRVRAEGASLVVDDDGPGLTPDEAERVRRPFVRGALHGDAPARPGAGLGLSIVDRVAAQAGARLELQSPPPGRPRGLRARIVFLTAGHNSR